ncbi:MAG: NAD-binding protein [Ignavibacteria bacterium]
MTNNVNNKAVMWRLAIPVIILILATIGFEAGVSVRYRPHIAEEGFLMHVLYAMSLFKVNGINLGMPTTGPLWAKDLLILMYFAAPAVSISAILEAVFRVARLKLRWILLRGGHAVVIGAGRATADLPAIIASEVKRRRWHGIGRTGVPIVIVDRSEDALLRNSTSLLKMQLDATDPSVVDTLNMKNARVVLLLTDDDQANIDLYFRLREKLTDVPENGHPQVFIRVRDMDLIRVLRTYNTTPKTRFFNVHIEAVRSLFVLEQGVTHSEWLSDQRDANQALSANWDALAVIKNLRPQRIVMVGFGRFGQHLLIEMMLRNDGCMVENLTSLAIISPDVFKGWAHFERLLLCNVSPGKTLPNPELTSGTHNDVGLLHSIAQESKDLETIFIIGTDDTPANIQAASVIQRFCAAHAGEGRGHATIIVRTNMFSMAHERLLHSGKSDNVDHVILPTYHVLGAYFSRRMRESSDL